MSSQLGVYVSKNRPTYISVPLMLVVTLYKHSSNIPTRILYVFCNIAITIFTVIFVIFVTQEAAHVSGHSI